MRRLLIFIALGLLANVAFAQEESQGLTIARAAQLMRDYSPLLKAKRLDVRNAEAQYAQSKSYENPTVEGKYNINNPVNHKWFDHGHDGETDITLEQPISIGGQHNEQVRKSKSLVESANYLLDDAFREQSGRLAQAMISLFYINRKLEIYEREAKSLENVEAAYKEQTSKGNISKMELQRIEAMLFSIRKERKDLELDAIDLQRDIKLMTGVDGIVVPVLDDVSIINSINSLPSLADLLSLAQTRPDLMAMGADIKANEHEVRLQRANALPQISLEGEYDKNGNIGHNTFLAGFNLSLPLWNHNKGNIQSAKVGLQQAQLQQQTAKEEQQADITKTYNSLCALFCGIAVPATNKDSLTSLRATMPQNQLQSSIEEMIANAADQYMKRNISLLEFIDLYDSYKETAFNIIETKEKVVGLANELNCKVGKEIIKL